MANPTNLMQMAGAKRQTYLDPYQSNLGSFLQNYMSTRLRSGLPSYYSKPAESKINQAYNSRLNALKQSGADRGAGSSGGMYNAMATLDTGRIGALGDAMSNMALQNLQYQQNMLQGLGNLESQSSARDMQLRQMQQQDYWNKKQMESQEGGFGDFLGGVLGLGAGSLTGGLAGGLGSKLSDKIL